MYAPAAFLKTISVNIPHTQKNLALNEYRHFWKEFGDHELALLNFWVARANEQSPCHRHIALFMRIFKRRFVIENTKLKSENASFDFLSALNKAVQDCSPPRCKLLPEGRQLTPIIHELYF